MTKTLKPLRLIAYKYSDNRLENVFVIDYIFEVTIIVNRKLLFPSVLSIISTAINQGRHFRRQDWTFTPI